MSNAVREALWLRHGCDVSALYGDDGEMQCGACRVDFKRDAPDVLIQAWERRHAALANTTAPEAVGPCVCCAASGCQDPATCRCSTGPVPDGGEHDFVPAGLSGYLHVYKCRRCGVIPGGKETCAPLPPADVRERVAELIHDRHCQYHHMNIEGKTRWQSCINQGAYRATAAALRALQGEE